MDEAKIYNVCLQRVKFQISNARERLGRTPHQAGGVILESYNTGDISEIVDILEIYDLEDFTSQGLREKLDDLAYTVSVLLRDRIAFEYDEEGNLGLYLVLNAADSPIFNESGAALLAA